ncbi:MAG: hypothetical protein V3T65_06900 [Acidobacteriota bacterium]
MYLGQSTVFLAQKAAQAGAYVQGKIKAFLALDTTITAMQVRARNVLRAASEKGDVPGVREAGQVLYDLSELRNDYNGTSGRVRDLLAKLPGLAPEGTGLGVVPVIPLVLMAVVVAVSIAMASIFRRSNAAERALRLVEEGVLTPAEAAALRPGPTGVFAGLAGATQYAAIGIGLYFGLPLVASLLKRRQRR